MTKLTFIAIVNDGTNAPTTHIRFEAYNAADAGQTLEREWSEYTVEDLYVCMKVDHGRT